jgi:hypothetical protein
MIPVARGTVLDEFAAIGTSLLNCTVVQFLGEMVLAALWRIALSTGH